jgi:hypothetical protein
MARMLRVLATATCGKGRDQRLGRADEGGEERQLGSPRVVERLHEIAEGVVGDKGKHRLAGPFAAVESAGAVHWGGARHSAETAEVRDRRERCTCR